MLITVGMLKIQVSLQKVVKFCLIQRQARSLQLLLGPGNWRPWRRLIVFIRPGVLAWSVNLLPARACCMVVFATGHTLYVPVGLLYIHVGDAASEQRLYKDTRDLLAVTHCSRSNHIIICSLDLGGLPLPLIQLFGSRVSNTKMFENINENLQFTAIWWCQVIRDGTESRRFSVPVGCTVAVHAV